MTITKIIRDPPGDQFRFFYSILPLKWSDVLCVFCNVPFPKAETGLSSSTITSNPTASKCSGFPDEEIHSSTIQRVRLMVFLTSSWNFFTLFFGNLELPMSQLHGMILCLNSSGVFQKSVRQMSLCVSWLIFVDQMLDSLIDLSFQPLSWSVDGTWSAESI